MHIEIILPAISARRDQLNEKSPVLHSGASGCIIENDEAQFKPFEQEQDYGKA